MHAKTGHAKPRWGVRAYRSTVRMCTGLERRLLLLGAVWLAACRPQLPAPTPATPVDTRGPAVATLAQVSPAALPASVVPALSPSPGATPAPLPLPTSTATAVPMDTTTVAPPETAAAAATPTLQATVSPDTATLAPTACAFAWFMPNPPPGCPGEAPVYALTVIQHFERGLLLWRERPDAYGSQIYAFFDDHQWPAWNPTNDRWRPGLPESDPALVPPPGYYQPVRGFGMFWRDAYFNPAGSARDRLGWATDEEFSLGERPMQCHVAGDTARGCFVSGPDDHIYQTRPTTPGPCGRERQAQIAACL
jgi:hypothetical protein